MTSPAIKPRIYVDSSVIGYLVNRPSTNLLTHSRQLLTQDWWELAQMNYEIFISQAVIDECGFGHPEAASRRVAISDEAIALSEQLMANGAVPQTEPEDALHIALATLHTFDVIATWNFAHMAGADAKMRLHAGIAKLGLTLPKMATPEELLEVPL
jgi:predicted nucleic acid-binding protein